MRIVVVSIYYKPEPVPKPHELAEGLAALGHQVTVLTGFPCYPEGRIYPGYRVRAWQAEEISGVRVLRLPLYPDHSARPAARLAHVLSFFLAVLTLGLVLCGPADVVYVWGNPPTSGLAGWVLGRVRRARFVYGVHDLWPEIAEESGMIRNRTALRLIGAIERFVLRRADVVTTISQGFRDRVVEKGVAPERAHVLPHWADDRVYYPVPPDREFAERLRLTGCFVVMYAGNLGRVQGLVEFVEAAALLRRELPRLKVVLIGDGVERESLVAAARSRDADNVLFLNRVPADEIRAYCALADALYVSLADTSLARLSVPSKLVTYLACGRPVLASVPGETAALVEAERVGLTCESGAADSIASAIRRMVALPREELQAMGQRAYATYQRRFSLHTLIHLHETLMDGALHRGSVATTDA